MTIEEMHQEVKQRFNKLDNEHRRYLTDVQIDGALNEGIRMYVDKYTHGLTDPRDGLERHQKSIDMLRTLVTTSPFALSGTNPAITLPDWGNTLQIKPYRHYISGRAYERDCPDKPYTLWLERHGNLDMVRRDYHRRASRRFRTIPITIDADQIVLWTDGHVQPVTADITYIAKPKPVCLGTYPALGDPDGSNKIKQESDLPADYHSQVVDFAIDYLARVYNMEKLLQITKDKIATAS